MCTNFTPVCVRAVAANCSRLKRLIISHCKLGALPDNIGNLSTLRVLVASRNQLTELPRSIVDLYASCQVIVNDNPLRTPPYELAMRGLPAIRQYFAGTATSSIA